MKIRSSAWHVFSVAAAACSVIALPAVAMAAPVNASTDAIGRCATADLTIQLGTGVAGVGEVTYPLEFTNSGTKACLMAGEPRILPVDSSSVQVGHRSKSQDTSDKTGFTMNPGDMAHSSVTIVDNMTARCMQVPGAMLDVFPPSERTGQVIPSFTFTACADKANVRVDPVSPGA